MCEKASDTMKRQYTYYTYYMYRQGDEKIKIEENIK